MSEPITPDGRPDLLGTEAPPPAALSYPCGDPPAPGAAREIAPGVLWLRLPLPFALNHINAWAIADTDAQGPGWAIVDTGTQAPATMDAWRSLLAPDGPLAASPQGARVTRVLCTHMHPDHVGMAGWLTRKFGVALWMTALEYLSCRVLAADSGREAPAEAIRFYRAAGWGEDALDVYRARFGGFGKHLHALPESFRRIVDGERIRIGAHDWQVITGRGHSPEHASLACDELGLLISGDQVLPRISPNVSVFPTEPLADPLGAWLAALERLRLELGDHLLVLPAHGEPFRGLHARLDRLAQGHQRGLQRLRRSLEAAPKRAIDVFAALFARQISGGDLLSMATGESLAHLAYLVARGEVVSELDAAGVCWYRLAAS